MTAVCRAQTENGDVWSVSRAIHEALRTHPLVRAAEARTRGGAAKLNAARALPPTSVALQHGAGNGTGGLDEDVAITQTFELGGKRSARTEQARADLRREQAGILAARFQVAYDAASACVDFEESQSTAEQTRAFLANAEAFRSAAQAQFALGEVPRTQVIRSEIEVAARQQSLDQAEEERENRLAALNRLLARPLDAALAVTVAGGPPATPAPLSRWQTLLAEQPELQAARAELASRQAALRVARAAHAPDLFVTGTHADFTSAQDNSVRAGLTFPLFDGAVRRAKRGEAESAIAEQQALLEDLRRTSEVELNVAYRSTERALGRLRRYQSGQLDQVRKLTELAKIGYEAGQTSYLEVLDAQRAQFEAETGYLHALGDSSRAWLSLLKAAAAPELLDDPFAAAGGPK